SVFSELLLDYEQGYSEDHILFYPHAVSLLYWDYEYASARTDYQAAKTFIAYLYDQFGSQNLSDIYHSQANSKTAIMSVVNQYYPDLSFEQLYMDFMVANIVDVKYQDAVISMRISMLFLNLYVFLLPEYPSQSYTHMIQLGLLILGQRKSTCLMIFLTLEKLMYLLLSLLILKATFLV
ncbi:MAG: hypothetical protein ACTSSO_06365, partial [Candidatus Hodarchaeales archaeon]